MKEAPCLALRITGAAMDPGGSSQKRL